MTEELNRLAQSVARVVLIEIGPKESQESVPAVGPGWCGSREVGEEGESLGLGEDRPQFASCLILQVEGSKQMEPDHGVSKRNRGLVLGAAPGQRQVTEKAGRHPRVNATER